MTLKNNIKILIVTIVVFGLISFGINYFFGMNIYLPMIAAAVVFYLIATKKK